MHSRRRHSDGVERQLVAMLFDQTSTLVAGGIALALAAGLCWQRTAQAWFALWGCLILVVLAGRVALERAYHRRRLDNGGSGGAWRARFTVGAWITGALWGAAALTIINHDDPNVQMLVITVETVIIMGAAARNASCPLAAGGQAALGLLPPLVACLASRDEFYREFSIFLVFAFFAAIKLIHYLHDRHIRLLTTDEHNASLVDAVSQANTELAAANERLECAATTDSLTGIANRRRFDAALADEVRRTQRDGSPLALLFLDIDAFKAFNDLYGHQAGDECLQRVAEVLAATFRRPADLVARYGGEEFAVILPQTRPDAALVLAEDIRANIEAQDLRNAGGPAGVVSVSIGVASFDAERFRRPEDFIHRADDAMYAAKAAGRNCVRTSFAQTQSPPASAVVAMSVPSITAA